MKWFKHQANAHKSDWCQRIFIEFGKAEGYGLFALFTAFFADKWNGESYPKFKIRLKELQNFMEVSPKKLRNFLGIPTDSESLTIKVSKDFVEVEFPNLLKIKDEYTRKSRKTPDKYPDKIRVEEKRTEEKRIKKYKKKKTAAAAPEGFADFYASYPRKVGKTQAEKFWAKEIKTESDKQEILKALDRYKANLEENGTEPRFIMHASTFVNRWKDWASDDAGKTSIDDDRWKRFLEKGEHDDAI